jgi:hypothetical protein
MDRTKEKQHEYSRFGYYHLACHPYGNDLTDYIRSYGYENIFSCPLCWMPKPSEGHCDECKDMLPNKKVKFYSDSDTDLSSDDENTDDLPMFPPPLVREVTGWK